ncbi:uncharacterized protein SPSK_08142 [Sporothrix schenckii 1099-18]|uniref:Uncharacterized protein n=1 Tax=Sporothrix schenckii 1099-18 TaxID=1397361 RepID=A0A0F2MI00_SPOSC|nr:uncharacterized protein SPSK_08142 [Sporothrix schenckii 1099-18]KJR87806.1 hypothetical protein SPSK_08142 [Sporothrix schenckii 1099-18]
MDMASQSVLDRWQDSTWIEQRQETGQPGPPAFCQRRSVHRPAARWCLRSLDTDTEEDMALGERSLLQPCLWTLCAGTLSPTGDISLPQLHVPTDETENGR